MKINILYDFKDGPWGGANQFLKGLKLWLESRNLYADIKHADVVIINSHTKALSCFFNKLQNPSLTIVQRIDGPMRLIRGYGKHDLLVHKACDLLANGTIFQSNWSKKENIAMGITETPSSKIILNAPDNSIFFPVQKQKSKKNKKIRLIASSWSGNIRKGFDTFKWLDDNLDFVKYEMFFVGNSPVLFKNIRHIKPQSSKNLANILRTGDIYICASKAEGCSNALLEALHCGLPALALNASSNSEVLKKNGMLFHHAHEIPKLLDEMTANYASFKENIQVDDFNHIAQCYYDFCKEVHNKKSNHINFINPLKILSLFYELFLDRHGYALIMKIKQYMKIKK